MRVNVKDMSGLSGLFVVAVDRVGVKQAALLVDTITGWEMTVRKYRRPVSAVEYGEHCGLSEPTAYRRLEQFREAFPEVKYPHELMGPLLKQLERDTVADTAPAASWVKLA
jgi:hypothetical protein